MRHVRLQGDVFIAPTAPLPPEAAAIADVAGPRKHPTPRSLRRPERLALAGSALRLTPAPSFGAAAEPKPPHLFFFLVDECAALPEPAPLRSLTAVPRSLGWGNVGWNRETPTPEVHTPTMDGLVASGIELQRHYVFSCCSPSRASVLSGRLPPHVETWLTDPDISNPADPESGWAGIPRSMTGVAKMLKKANFSSHAVGKCRLHATCSAAIGSHG